jgi:UDP-N-acetylglucosamine 2-epimerase (non-hydrolysing)
LERKPDLVLVYGDVNSTVAAALVAAKLDIKIGHVEAGLRSFDRSMPEEINRVVTDRISDFLFTPSCDADMNLRLEGVKAEKIHRVGNVMIDSLIRLQPLVPYAEQYALVTLHRPSNVDDVSILKGILKSLHDVSKHLQVIFPAHPRTRQRMIDFGLDFSKLQIIDPTSYVDFLKLESSATVVITDSGGIQEETTYLGVPCLTLRTNTERPITVDLGTNVLVGQDKDKLLRELTYILEGKGKSGSIPPLWDGHAGERIAEIVLNATLVPVVCPT